MNRYFSTERPITPGACPSGFTEVGNFSGKTYCDAIEAWAWGYVDYEEPLTPEQETIYDLVKAGSRQMKVLKELEESMDRMIERVKNKLKSGRFTGESRAELEGELLAYSGARMIIKRKSK